MSGKLYIVGTPIGNLEDITLRAIRVLKEADLIAAEDTRRAGLLLQHLGISKKKFLSYHHFNQTKRRGELFRHFEEGKNIALVSDAGMPGVSDPGERLIRDCVEENVPVEVIPGPSAVLHALVASGFAAIPFHFGGFLPVKANARIRELQKAAERDCTSVYFESPHRLTKTLAACAELFPERKCCVARELTKKFEQILINFPPNLLQHFTTLPPKGEITFLVSSA